MIQPVAFTVQLPTNCSIQWHYRPQSSLDLPYISVLTRDTTAHNQALTSQIYVFHPLTLQPTIKPWPPKYICSFQWHYNPQSTLDLPNISFTSFDTTAHIQALTSQIYLFHPLTLQPTIKPWPPKYICSIQWNNKPQSSLDLPNITFPFIDTTVHNEALTSQTYL